MAAAQNPLTLPDLSAYRVLATDLDGTLLRADHSVSDRTREILQEGIASGIRVVFVTGRPPRWMPAVGVEAGHFGTAICANGAVVIDMETESITANRPMLGETMTEVVGAATDLFSDDASIGAEQALVGPIQNSRLVHDAKFLPPGMYRTLAHRATQLPVTEIVQQPGIVKMMVRLPGAVADADAAAAALETLIGDQATITFSSKTHQLLEIAPPQVTKASALAALVTTWGLSSQDVVAVGDMPNDLPMIAWAGHGFAVASAHPALLAVCQSVAPDPEHDGVAQILAAMIAAQRDPVEIFDAPLAKPSFNCQAPTTSCN